MSGPMAEAGTLPAGASAPSRIGPYRVVRRLGAGGMGEVFLGRDAGGGLAAVKVVHAGLAAEARFRARFAREVATVRAIRAPWAAAVINADTHAAMPWLATEYVAGPSLQRAVSAAGPLPEASVVALAHRLAGALTELHAVGLVHRDLKPSNVLLAADTPRLIDFGIARAVDATAVTHTGMVLGTPAFMSPEQALGEEIGPASDVFSLASVLVHAATGQGPFGSASHPVAMLRRICDEQPDLAGVPDALREVLRPCLAKDPAERPTATVLAERLAGLRSATDAWPPPDLAALIRDLPTAEPARPPRLSRRAMLVALGAAGAVALAAGLAARAGDSGWGRPPAPAPRPGGALRWTYAAGTEVNHVAAAGGLVYAACQNGTVYALDAATGQLRWKFGTRDPLTRPIVVSGGVLYVDNDSSWLYALDAATGRLRWEKKLAWITTASGDVPIGGIYGHGGQFFVGFDPANGDVRWRQPPPGDTSYAAEGMAEDGRVHLGSRTLLATLQARTGTVEWQRPWSVRYKPTFAATDGTVIGLADNAVVSWDAASGAERWRQPTDDDSTMNVIAANGTAYRIGMTQLTAWHAVTGRSLWTVDQKPSQLFVSEATVSGDTFYTCQHRSEVASGRTWFEFVARAVDNGDERWTLPIYSSDTIEGSVSPLVSTGDAVFFGVGHGYSGNGDGSVYALTTG